MNATGIPSRRLRDLLDGLEAELPAGAGDLRIRSVTCDSRTVEPGSLFIAMRGERFDGHDFVPAAAAAGAAAALVETPPADPGIPVVRVPDARRAAGPVAAAFHGRPSDAMRLVGVTGTNGKTTVAWLLDAIFQQETSGGLYCGTVAAPGARRRPPPRTRRGRPHHPGGPRVPVPAGARARRGVPLRRGRMLFARPPARDGSEGRPSRWRSLPTSPATTSISTARSMPTSARSGNCSRSCSVPAGTAVIGWDDPFGVRLVAELEEHRPDVRVVGFGSDPGATIRLSAVRSDLDGTRVSLDGPAGRGEISSPMLGHFSALNLAAAWGALTALGFDGARAAEVLSGAAPPPGRMERVGAPRGSRRGRKPAVLVDYAHTPDALARALAAARCLVGDGRLHVVFGCGGERDRGNRAAHGRRRRPARRPGRPDLRQTPAGRNPAPSSMRSGWVRRIRRSAPRS